MKDVKMLIHIKTTSGTIDRRRGKIYSVTDASAARMEKEGEAVYVNKEDKPAIETKEEKIVKETKAAPKRKAPAKRKVTKAPK